MNFDKNPFTSVTVWGVIIGMISFAGLKFYGVEIPVEQQNEMVNSIVNTITTVGVLIGAIIAFIGRFRK